MELINAAYARTELLDAEREERVAKALKARTLGDLRDVTHDLQGVAEDEFGAQRPDPGHGSRPPTRGTSSSSAAGAGAARSRVAVILATVLATCLAVVLAFVGLGVYLSAKTVDQRRSVPVLTEHELQRFLDHYRAEFDTTRAFDVEIYDDWIKVQVPVESGTQRYVEQHYDNGTFRENRRSSASDGVETVDLADLDTAALVANVERASRELVESVDAEKTWVRIGHETGSRVGLPWPTDPGAERTARPLVIIAVSTEFDETGYWLTDPSGALLAKKPAAGDWTIVDPALR